MCYSAAAIANYFIEKSRKTDAPISNMHLQKMIFFAHAAFFKQTGKPLFSDPVVAWQHGPVVESLYHALKQYGTGCITELIPKFERIPDSKSFSCRCVFPSVPEDSPYISFLNQVWEKLSGVETWRLRALSHAKGGAWYETVCNLKTDTGKNVDPSNDDEVRNFLPRNLTILDSVIKKCGR